MKRLLCFLIVVAAAGVPVYLSMRPEDFGVSPKDPLGRFEEFDAWLGERKQKQQTVDLEETILFEAADDTAGLEALQEIDGATVIAYDEPDRYKTGATVCRTTLVKDPSGAVRAVAAQFWSGREKAGSATWKPEILATLLWERIGGKLPDFEDHEHGRGIWYKASRFATLEKGRVRAAWYKEYMSSGHEKTIFDVVLFWLE